MWSEAENYDLALSFQEKAGCDEIWEKICQVSAVVPSPVQGFTVMGLFLFIHCLLAL